MFDLDAYRRFAADLHRHQVAVRRFRAGISAPAPPALSGVVRSSDAPSERAPRRAAPPSYRALLSVNVSFPRELGRIVSGGREVAVVSGIAKRQVRRGSLSGLGRTWRAIGRPICACTAGRTRPSTPTRRTLARLGARRRGADVRPGIFGENLTAAGITEDAVCIGDVWAWGEARLQVSQPRGPCYKLEMPPAGRA